MKITTQQLFDYDLHLNSSLICGVDEAGRGPLAGPVVCASVIMPLDKLIFGVNDSKKLSQKLRESLFSQIIEVAIDYQIAIIDNQTIDRVNILNATKLGMEQAILGLKVSPDIILVDAVKGLQINRDYTALTKGDATSYSIACASILAKVARDKIMTEMCLTYPQYSFSKHKGYGTTMHIEAIRTYGATPIHRQSFIKNFLV